MRLSALILDPSAQPRATLDEKLIDDYAESLRRGAVFPPVIAYGTERRAHLADGWHRYHAAQAAERTEIAVDLRPGNLDDAVWHSVTANAEHGLRRSNADKDRAVTTALSVKPTLADTEIARHCSVDHSMVARIRKRLEGAGTIEPSPVREHTRGGAAVRQRVKEPTVRPVPKPGSGATASRTAAPEPAGAQDEPVDGADEPINAAVAAAVIKRYRRLPLWDPDEAIRTLTDAAVGLTTEEIREIRNWFIRVVEAGERRGIP